MLLGDLHPSNLLVVIFLFFGTIAVGFGAIGETHYAIISIIIPAIVHFFNDAYANANPREESQIAFGIELEALSKMVTYGLAPVSLLIRITEGSVAALVVSAFYLLAVAVRIAHFNRPLEMQGELEPGIIYGLPLVSIAIALPILSLISWVIPLNIAGIIWLLVFAVLLVGFVIKYPLPKIPANYKFALLGLGLVAVVALLVQGTLIK
ncbi:hypothetical protein [Tuanshanicoccus lijuaniae]|uniref:hypothetical protein n=1 Tax=Aerococcaceae bacterium zg-1292 TaxID=2774330 RepID=UPI001BD854AC|nr:hypothetical protein [Aerococcaceae bacterium zg-A91]MBS4458169.1 hypothetical protein [Aerococcaceae bacterium zg-BR33]